MKFAQNNHPARLFGPTCLFGTWEYGISFPSKNLIKHFPWGKMNQAHKSPRIQVPDTLMSPTPTCPRHPHVPHTHMSPTPTCPRHPQVPQHTCPRHPHVPNTHMSPTPTCPRHTVFVHIFLNLYICFAMWVTNLNNHSLIQLCCSPHDFSKN